MPTGVKQLTSAIKRSRVRSKHDVVDFFQTQSALFGDRVECWGPVKDFPLYCVLLSFLFQFQHMMAKCSGCYVMLVSFVSNVHSLNISYVVGSWIQLSRAYGTAQPQLVLFIIMVIVFKTAGFSLQIMFFFFFFNRTNMIYL